MKQAPEKDKEMGYYYATRSGEFVDSTAPIDDPKYIRLNEQQYLISRLIVRGYNRREIIEAINDVYKILVGEPAAQPARAGEGEAS